MHTTLDPSTSSDPLSARARQGLLDRITQHDILNQIAAIQGHLSLALTGLPEGPLRDHISAGLRASLNIWKHIDFIRECQDTKVRAPSWQDVEALFRKIALTSDLQGAALRIDVNGLEVLADPLLAEVFHNLVDNSLAHGGKVRKISVTCQEREGWMDLICSDDGTGVPAEMKRDLFAGGPGKNTGLGLCSEILARDGMSMAENGRPGEGARFVISVPAGRCRFQGGRGGAGPAVRSAPAPLPEDAPGKL